MTKELIFHEEFPYVARILKDKVMDPFTWSAFRDELVIVYNWKLEDYREFEGFLKNKSFVWITPFLSNNLTHLKTLGCYNQSREDYVHNMPTVRIASELAYVLGEVDD